MVHMAPIFLEDLCTPIPTAVVRAEMLRRHHALKFVDKVIEIRREVCPRIRAPSPGHGLTNSAH